MFEIRQCQWCNRKLMFTVYMQHRAAGYQNLEVGTCCQQLRKPRCGHQHLLKVVEQQQQLLVFQVCFQEVEHRLIANLFGSKFLSDSGNDQVRIADGGQRNEADTVGEVIEQVARDLQAQVSFADTTRACESHEARFRSKQEIV